MTASVTCSCGYRGPAITHGGTTVCPICQVPASAAASSLTMPPAPAATATPTRVVPAVAPSHTYRIPCPRGHVLQASERMLDQQVVCPQCNEVFTLRMADSLEHRKERQRLEREQEEQAARRWLARAVWAAAFIVASLVGMIVFSFVARGPQPDDRSSEPDPAVRSE